MLDLSTANIQCLTRPQSHTHTTEYCFDNIHRTVAKWSPIHVDRHYQVCLSLQFKLQTNKKSVSYLDNSFIFWLVSQIT